MERKEEHYVDNEEFYNLLCENKNILKTHYHKYTKNIDYSEGVEKLKFKKQLNIFKCQQIKIYIKQKKIKLSIEQLRKFTYLQKKINDILKIKKSYNDPDNKLKNKKKLDKYTLKLEDFLNDVYIPTKLKTELNKLTKKEKEKLQVNETLRRENKVLIHLVKTKPIPKGRYRRVQNLLGEIFLSICRGVLTKPNFINYTWDRKDDMISEATFHMSRYVLLFDVRQKYPFSYFTTVCTRAFLQCLNKQKKYSDKFQPLIYIENMHLNDAMKEDDWN